MEFLASKIKQQEAIKGIQVEKEKMKWFLLANDMTVHTENSQENTKTENLLQLKSKFIEATGYRINIQKFYRVFNTLAINM